MFKVKVNLGFHKYVDGGPIMDVPVSDVLAHFKGVSIFLEAAAQHTTREIEEAIYYPCKVCNNNVMYLYKDHEIIYEHLVQSGFMYNYFIWSKHGQTQPRTKGIIDERNEGNINADHV
jgi:hypothetical protein